MKVLSKKDFSAIVEGEFTEDGKPMTKAEKQWREAVEQIHRYAEAPRVEACAKAQTPSHHHAV